MILYFQDVPNHMYDTPCHSRQPSAELETNSPITPTNRHLGIPAALPDGNKNILGKPNYLNGRWVVIALQLKKMLWQWAWLSDDHFGVSCYCKTLASFIALVTEKGLQDTWQTTNCNNVMRKERGGSRVFKTSFSYKLYISLYVSRGDKTQMHIIMLNGLWSR